MSSPIAFRRAESPPSAEAPHAHRHAHDHAHAHELPEISPLPRSFLALSAWQRTALTLPLLVLIALLALWALRP